MNREPSSTGYGADCAGIERSAAVLQAVRESMAPMIRLLISNGVGHHELSRVLKPDFIEAARAAIVAENRLPTQAALSLRAGVQRKNGLVSINAAEGERQEAAAEFAGATGVAVSVLRKWLTDPAYCDATGKPMPLSLVGAEPSFQSLVAGVTTDYSKRSVLDELVGLGFARENATGAEMVTAPETISAVFGRACRDLAAHVGDHLEAGVANLIAVRDGNSAPCLEHSVYGNGLSDRSLQLLSELAGKVWQQACTTMAQAARRRFDEDQASVATLAKDLSNSPPRGRMRFGAYLYRR